MNNDCDFFANVINAVNVNRVVSVRPSDKAHKERGKKDNNRNERRFDGANKVSFIDCLLEMIEEQKDCEEDNPKKVLK